MQKIKQDLGIGHNLRRMRMECHFTQEIITAKLQLMNCSMSRSAYAHIECGNSNIRISELTALKKIFNCSYEDFFEGVEEEFDKMLERLDE